MRPANGIVVLHVANGRANPGLAVGMSDLVPSKANVRTDGVLLGLEGPLSARGEDKLVMKLSDRTAIQTQSDTIHATIALLNGATGMVA